MKMHFIVVAALWLFLLTALLVARAYVQGDWQWPWELPKLARMAFAQFMLFASLAGAGYLALATVLKSSSR